jgi:HSP20 family protein
MDQLFERSFVNPQFMAAMSDSPSLMAPMDVCETPNGYEVDVALPGVRPEDIELTVDQNALTLRGQYNHQNRHHEQHQGQPQSASSPQQSSSSPNMQTTQQGSPSSSQHDGGQSMQSSQQSTAAPQQQGHTWLAQEIVSGSFERTITFPKMIDPDKIQTTFQNGILTIMVPVSEASRPKRISVSKQSQLQGSTAGN